MSLPQQAWTLSRLSMPWLFTLSSLLRDRPRAAISTGLRVSQCMDFWYIATDYAQTDVRWSLSYLAVYFDMRIYLR